jgi:hypothetical protein
LWKNQIDYLKTVVAAGPGTYAADYAAWWAANPVYSSVSAPAAYAAHLRATTPGMVADYALYRAAKAEADRYLPGGDYGNGFTQLTVTAATPGYPTILTVAETITPQYGDADFAVGGIGTPGDCWNSNTNQVDWRVNTNPVLNSSLTSIVVTGTSDPRTATASLQFFSFAGGFVGAKWTVAGSNTAALNGTYTLSGANIVFGPSTISFQTTGVPAGTYDAKSDPGLYTHFNGYNLTDGTLVSVVATAYTDAATPNVVVSFPSGIGWNGTPAAAVGQFWTLAGTAATSAGLTGNWAATGLNYAGNTLTFTIPGVAPGTYTTGDIVATYQRALQSAYMQDGNTASINYQAGNLLTTATLIYHQMAYLDPHHVQVLWNSSNCPAWSGTAYGFQETGAVTGQIDGYTGGSWAASGIDLALMYQLTGDTRYSDQARSLLDYIDNLVSVGNNAMITADSGYPARNVWYVIGVLRDWLWPTLTTAERTASANTIRTFYHDMWLVAQSVRFDQSSSWLADVTDCGRSPSTKCVPFSPPPAPPSLYQWIFHGGTAFADSNYWGGIVTGMSYMAMSLVGDDPEGATMLADADAQFDGQMAAAFDCTPGKVGPICSGLSQEFYGYGNRNLGRLVMLMVARNYVEGINLFSTTTYAQKLAKAAIYGLQPNGWHALPEWNTTAEGYSGMFDTGLPQILSIALAGTTEGGWMQHMNNHVSKAPPDAFLLSVQSAQFGGIGEALLWSNGTNPSVDYTASLPTYLPNQPGDGHTYYRSGWGSDGLWAAYRGSPIDWGPHNTTSAGNIEIVRGNDYVLPNSDQWRGCNGYEQDGASPPNCPFGNGTSETLLGNGYFNTFFFWDNGETALLGGDATCFPTSYYYGCQAAYSDYNTAPPISTANSNYVYTGSNLSMAYHGGFPHLYPYPLSSTPIDLYYYFRDFMALGDGAFVVWDRVQSKKPMNDGVNFTGNIRWNFPTNTPTISGNTASAVVGGSKIYISSFLPSGATPTLTVCENDVNAIMGPTYKTGYATSSTTSLTIANTGLKTLTVDPNLNWTTGQRVMVRPSANTAFYMTGLVTSYSGTTLMFTSDESNGSGTFASWNIELFKNDPLLQPWPCTTPTTTLTAAITDTTGGARTISIASGAGIVNGVYIYLDSETVFVVSGGGTANPTVRRGDPGAAVATHLNGATVFPVQRLANIRRIEVSDPTPSTNLNVLTAIYVTASGGSQPTTTKLSTIDANHIGLLVNDTIPKVAVFSTAVNGIGVYPAYAVTNFNHVTYSATCSPGPAAKHVVANLFPNAAWTATLNGSGIASGTTDASGTAFFTDTTGGGAFVINQSAIPALAAGPGALPYVCTAGGANPASVVSCSAQHNRITMPIDRNRTVAIQGHIHRYAQPLYDQGRVAGSLLLNNLTLLLKPSAEQQSALGELLATQQDPSSERYQQWLSPEEFADRFAPSQADITYVTRFLEAEGFTVTHVAQSRNWIAFQGTAAQVENAFATEIHHYRVNGELHIANASDPRIPEALSELVSGIRGLHDFLPHVPRSKVRPFYTLGSGGHYLAPDDLATIYNLKDLFNLGIDGTGQKLAVVGQSAIDIADIQNFRTAFSLPKNDPQVVLVPGKPDPGVLNGDVIEADLGVEWAGAAAKNAALIYVYAPNVFDAVEYVVSQKLAVVISMSYGVCELGHQSTALQLQALAQQANAEGITWLNASGDSGAPGCALGETATQGLAVNLPSSIPEVSGVGGTAANDAQGARNDTATTRQLEGGGGASVVFARPVWQTGPGVPADGSRHVPDVAMPTSHGAIICTGGSCANGLGASGVAVGGTSLAAPIFAGIVALLNQYQVSTGASAAPGLGNINPALYALAQNTTDAFHDITADDNIVPCQVGAPNCISGTTGYRAGRGYDRATGLGSVNAYNLVTEWRMSKTKPMAVTPSGSVQHR